MSKKLKVLSIHKGTQAEKLGIKVGDLVVSYNGKLVSSNTDLSSVISEAKEAAVESVILVVSRKGQEMSLQVTLETLGFVCDEVSELPRHRARQQRATLRQVMGLLAVHRLPSRLLGGLWCSLE